MRLEGCIFSDNTPSLPLLQADNRNATHTSLAGFFSDSAGLQVCNYYDPDIDSGTPRCMEAPVGPLQQAGDVFLTAEEEWFVTVQQVRGSGVFFLYLIPENYI